MVVRSRCWVGVASLVCARGLGIRRMRCHRCRPRCRRPGLSARQPLFGGPGPSADDQLQISIESGTLDIDSEIDQLRSSVGRLKQVGAGGRVRGRRVGRRIVSMFWCCKRCFSRCQALALSFHCNFTRTPFPLPPRCRRPSKKRTG